LSVGAALVNWLGQFAPFGRSAAKAGEATSQPLYVSMN
jgi:hypothetical protein